MMLFVFLLGVMSEYTPTQSRITVQGTQGSTMVSGFIWSVNFSEANARVWAGGAIHYDTTAQSQVSVLSCKFVACWNGWEGGTTQSCPDGCKGGGAIFVNSLDLQCSNCVFEDCKAVSGRGGAIFARAQSSATVSTCWFTRCVASGRYCPQVSGGGAVAVNEKKLDISDCHFDDCSCASFGGGAIFVNGTIQCSSCWFTRCWCPRTDVNMSGGAVWLNASAASSVYECEFKECDAHTAGGVYFTGTGKLDIYECLFEDCTAGNSPACLFLNGPAAFRSLNFTQEIRMTVLKITNSITSPYQIYDCHVNGKGGVLQQQEWIAGFADDAAFDIENCSFTSYKKSGNGGGVFRFNTGGTTDRKVTVTNCSFTDMGCTGTEVNGGVFAFRETYIYAIITGCQFEGCQAELSGGALFFSFNDPNKGRCEITDCTFISNQAKENGQSLQINFLTGLDNSDRYVIQNCTFSEHRTGSPLFLKPQSGNEFGIPWQLDKLIFEDNTVVTEAGLIGLWSAGSRATIDYTNCVFRRNESPSGGILALCKPNYDPGSDRTCTFEMCTFENCRAAQLNLITLTTRVNLKFQECTFSTCTGGGAVVLSSNETDACNRVTVAGCTFEACSASGPVFGFESGGCDSEFDETTFSRCRNTLTGRGRGGQLFFGENFEGSVLIEHCQFLDCTAANDGGAIGFYYSNGQSHILRNCTFANNQADYTGKSLRIALNPEAADKLGSFVVTGCTFSGHQGSPIGATLWGGGKIDINWILSNCTFRDNSEKSDEGYGIVRCGAHVSYDNCSFFSNTAGTSGILKICETGHYTSCELSSCYFEGNTHSSGLIVVPTGCSIETLALDKCYVVNSNGAKGILNAPEGNPTTLSITDCTFEGCTISGSNLIATSGCTSVTMRGNSVIDCDGTSSVISIVSVGTLVFEENILNLSIEEGKSAVSLALSDNQQALVLTRCTFGNQNHQTSSRFVALPNNGADYRNVLFDNCIFEEISFAGGGAAIGLSMTSSGSSLEVVGCSFSSCRSTNDGGAIHSQDTKDIEIRECTFEDCSCNVNYDGAAGGGGAVYIKHIAETGSVTDCVFVNNNSPKNGQSLQIACDTTPCERIDISNCTFRGHNRGSILAFIYNKNSDFVYMYDGMHTLSNCHFENNDILGHEVNIYGVFRTNCSQGVTYENCSFRNCAWNDYDNAAGLMCSGISTGTFVLSGCKFTECGATPANAGLFMTSKQITLRIDNCTLQSCRGAFVHIQSNDCTIELDHIQFTECDGSNPALLTMGASISDYKCSRFSMLDCQFTKCCWYHANGLMDLRASQAAIEDCVFSQARGKSSYCIRVKLFTTDQIAFTRCKFSLVDEEGDGGVNSFILAEHGASGLQTGRITCNDCTFENLKAYYEDGRENTGIAILAKYSGNLDVIGCHFTDVNFGVQDASHGAAIAVKDLMTVTIDDVEFARCTGRTVSGAVYCDMAFSEAIIRNCRFIENSCLDKQQAQALQFVLQEKASGMTITNCSFAQHTGHIIRMKRQDQQRYQYSVRFEECVFKQNSLGAMGVVEAKVKGITYYQCSFEDITRGEGSYLITMDDISNLLILEYSNFTNCQVGTSVVTYTQEQNNLEVDVIHCEFRECETTSSLIDVQVGGISTLSISETFFDGCQATTGPAVLNVASLGAGTSTINTLTLKNNRVSGCSGSSDIRSAWIASIALVGSLTFDGNKIIMSPPGEGNLLKFDMDDFTCENCLFDGSGYSWNDQSGRLILCQDGSTMVFHNCDFQNINPERWGIIYIPQTSSTGTGSSLTFTECQFSNIASQNDASCIYSGWVKQLSVTDCIFDSCTQAGTTFNDHGGACIYTRKETENTVVRNCSFLDCHSNQPGMAVQFSSRDTAPATFDISNCTFSGHLEGKTTGTAWLRHLYRNAAGLELASPHEFVISQCKFENIKLTTQTGLVLARSTAGIVFTDCEFSGNTVADLQTGLISVNLEVQLLRFVKCKFEGTSTESQMKRLIALNTSTTVPQLFELSECSFKGLVMQSGLIGFTGYNARQLADNTFGRHMVVSGCNFESCRSADTSSSFLTLACENLTLVDNEFTDTTSGGSLFSLQVSAEKSTIRDMWFQAVSTMTLLDVTCNSGSEIEFYNCCFTHTGESAASPIFMKLSNQGSVSFSVVCFDADKQSSLLISGNEIEYDGNPDDFFAGRCGCWDMSGPTTTQQTEDPEAGGAGGKSNAGLIAGVVIAVIVIIVIVVLVILLLLRRRKRVNTDDEVNGNEEFTEETITTAHDEQPAQTMGEWSQTTEDNPLFTTETPANDNPFSNAFEEGGFFGNE